MDLTATILLPLLAAAAASPGAEGTLVVPCARTNTAPVIDGRLDDVVWQRAPVFSRFVQAQPDENAAPSFTTEVRVLYDDEHLYVAARLLDPEPETVVARLGRRDLSTGSDAFYLYVDSFNDHRNAVYFALDAAGSKIDGVITNDTMNENDWDAAWNGVWEGESGRDEHGWIAEMAIPLSQLRFHAGAEVTWGIDFRRDISRRDESDYVVFTPRAGSGFVSRFPHLTGLSAIPPPHQIELSPYATLEVAMTPGQRGDPFHKGTEYLPNAGLDFKMGLSSDLTLDGAINPDFGQAEVDPAVVNLSDIETYYEEKRPFFIAGSNTFKFGSGGVGNTMALNWSEPQLFYSRRIGRKPQGEVPESDFSTVPQTTRILGAVKLTGRATRTLSIGSLHALTNREMGRVSVSGDEHSFEAEPYTYYGAVRGLAELDDGREGVGVMATLVARDLSDDRLAEQLSRNAAALGVDGWAFLDDHKEWVLTGWLAGSYVNGTEAYLSTLQENSQHYLQRPDYHFAQYDDGRTSLVGAAGRVRLEKVAGGARFYSAIGAIDPRFDVNAMGYLGETDIVNAHLAGGYKWLNPVPGIVRDLTVLQINAANFNFDGRAMWAAGFAVADIQLASFDFLELFVGYAPFETTNTRRTRGGPMTTDPANGYHAEASFVSAPGRPWVVESDVYTDGSPAGATNHADVSLQVRPLSSLSLSIGPGVDWVRSHSAWVGAFDDSTAAATYGRRYVFADLWQTTVSVDLRVDLTFTPTLTFQLFVQPFVSNGRYRHFKELARAESYAFREYGHDAGTITRDSGEITVSPAAAPGAASFTFDDPDFSTKSLRGNAVLRWEYLPGSLLYVVWTHTRERDDGGEDLVVGRAVRQMFDSRPENIFMVKLSYWWDP